MNCEQFEANWQGLVSQTLDDPTKTEMQHHGRSCHNCGKRWEEHKELSTTIQTVIESQKLSPDLADRVANEVYQKRFGAAFNFNAPTSSAQMNISQSNGKLILAAIAGCLFGYFLAGGRSNNSQQLLNAQLTSGRYGGRDMYEMMLYAELMGGGSGGLGGLAGGAMPAITSTVSIMFFVILLIWLTRSRVWDQVFPSRLPMGLYVARWISLLAAIIGLLRCATGLFLSVIMISGPGMGRGIGMQTSWLISMLMFMNQLWSLGFWLTLIVLFFTVASHVAVRFVGQPPSAGTYE